MLEGAAARLSAERLVDDSELATMRKYRDAMESMLRPNIDSFAYYLELNEAFHTALADLSKSPLLRRMLERVKSLPFASPSSLVFAPSKLPQSASLLAIGQEHHSAIVEAIQSRQGARAESVAREHAQLSRRNLESVLADRDILNTLPGAALIRLPALV
jgi:GntR family transcriptional regulator of vanillate catabolism